MSSPLIEVVDYIVERIDKPGRPSDGIAYIKEHFTEEKITELVAISFEILQLSFTKATSDNPAGECRLTAVSSLIGTHIMIPDDSLTLYENWALSVRIGDLFIEAYYNTGFVDLYYPQIRSGWHIVLATNKWTEIEPIDTTFLKYNLRGTVTERPDPIKGASQRQTEEDKPIIKGSRRLFDLDQPWLRAMNKLQRTGWKINSRVLKAMQENEKDFISFEKVEDNDAKEQKRRSKVIEWKYTIAKATRLVGEETFYQFLEADYRGRLYYSEPFLNFQGSDIARGIMQFSRGKPMDKHGLFWLAVHTACSYNQSYNKNEIPDWCEADYYTYLEEEGLESISVDKMTLEDRVRWTNENMHWIRQAGVDCTFYHEAEKTISFLACCLEWHDYNVAVDCNEVHYTRLPIPIDGSNNGWQHLGAISKDPKTGELVGLVPVEIQRDFYVQTAKELYNLTEDERLKSILDAMPMKHIRKGISKRGSMTRAYSAGAGKIGENMWFDCKTEDFHEKYGITLEDCKAFAKILIKAINNVCPGPLSTMKYLQILAANAVGEKGDKLEWTTPSGFRVVYSCNHVNKVNARGTISGYTKYNKNGQVNHVAQLETEFPDMRGFMCGISPNYIHSMDASHMARVIDKWNGDFGAVHDSFSTHAPDVELLLAHTKREFIDMYDVENYYHIIEHQLIEDIDDVITDRPVLGDLNIEEIEDSDYFFA